MDGSHVKAVHHVFKIAWHAETSSIVTEVAENCEKKQATQN